MNNMICNSINKMKIPNPNESEKKVLLFPHTKPPRHKDLWYIPISPFSRGQVLFVKKYFAENVKIIFTWHICNYYNSIWLGNGTFNIEVQHLGKRLRKGF